MLANAELKQIRALAHRKYRQQYGQYILEGNRLISAALEARVEILTLVATREFLEHPGHRDLLEKVEQRHCRLETVTARQMERLTDTATPPGILAVCSLAAAGQLPPALTSDWLYLDGIADPGNLGTLLRTAAWFGVRQVACSAGTADPYSPKVVRSGMGAHFHLELHPEISLPVLKRPPVTVIGADPEGLDIRQVSREISSPWILVIGNEAHGISRECRPWIDIRAAIPRRGALESLNAAVAGGILLQLLTDSSS